MYPSFVCEVAMLFIMFSPTATLQYGWKSLPLTAQHMISWCITSCNSYIIGLNHLSQYILLHHSENPLNHWICANIIGINDWHISSSLWHSPLACNIMVPSGKVTVRY